MKALLVLTVGNGGGLGSKVQSLFLANPWLSRGPKFENYTWRAEYLRNEVKEHENMEAKEDIHT